jgi:hypothetical protein
VAEECEGEKIEKKRSICYGCVRSLIKFLASPLKNSSKEYFKFLNKDDATWRKVILWNKFDF